MVDRKKRRKKADIEYLFEHGEVIIYTLDVVSIHPVTTKIQASFLTQLPEKKETQGFHHGGFKTVSLKAVLGKEKTEDGSTTL